MEENQEKCRKINEHLINISCFLGTTLRHGAGAKFSIICTVFLPNLDFAINLVYCCAAREQYWCKHTADPVSKAGTGFMQT